MVCAAARIDPLEALQVPVTLEPDVTGLALSPGSLTVTNASDGGTLEAVGEDAPALSATTRIRPILQHRYSAPKGCILFIII